VIRRALLAAGLALAQASQASQPVLERPQILGIARVVFRVSSIEPARQFYGHVLGLLSEGATTGGCVRYRVNDRQEIAIEPGLPADEDERLSYLAFETASVDTLGMYLRAHGVTPELHAPTTACSVARALWVKDPDGHLVAFFESHRPPESDPTTDTRAVSTRVLHAGLTIANAAASDRFYKDVLGFSEIWRGGRTDDVISWINMKVPNGTDYIEYMLVNGPVSRQQRGTLHHVALLVPDIQTALETVRNRTPEPDREKIASPQVGRNRRWQLNLYDPDGTRTELMEPHTMR
jgi:catechol 2,3-dioxygenase-like lactoylglutathione lyase family enzyme